jgi:hypothetical protein
LAAFRACVARRRPLYFFCWPAPRSSSTSPTRTSHSISPSPSGASCLRSYPHGRFFAGSRLLRPSQSGVAAGAVGLVQLASGLAPTLGHREYAGASRVLERLDARLGPGSPLVLFGPHDVVLHRFGPAIGIGRGRVAFPVTELRARRLVDWLLARARTRRTLLVTYGRRLPDMDRERLRATPVARVALSLPEMERPLDRLPRRAGRLSGELVVWRLRGRIRPLHGSQ